MEQIKCVADVSLFKTCLELLEDPIKLSKERLVKLEDVKTLVDAFTKVVNVSTK